MSLFFYNILEIIGERFHFEIYAVIVLAFPASQKFGEGFLCVFIGIAIVLVTSSQSQTVFSKKTTMQSNWLVQLPSVKNYQKYLHFIILYKSQNLSNRFQFQFFTNFLVTVFNFKTFVNVGI